MQKEIAAALKAAKAYKPRNAGDESSVELIVALLQDVSTRVPMLTGLADGYEKRQALADAQNAVRAAEAGLSPDAQLKP